MANDQRTKEEFECAVNLDTSDPLSEVVRAAEQGQQALDHLQTMVADTALRLEELARANAVFESVADRLVAATLKASRDVTSGEGANRASFGLVEELAELARRSLLASGNGRSQLREYQKTAVPTRVAAHEAHTALETLSTLLKQLAEASRANALIPAIEVESRVLPPPVPKDATSSWTAAPPRRGGYKN
jgi:hypothetical protein